MCPAFQGPGDFTMQVTMLASSEPLVIGTAALLLFLSVAYRGPDWTRACGWLSKRSLTEDDREPVGCGGPRTYPATGKPGLSSVIDDESSRAGGEFLPSTWSCTVDVLEGEAEPPCRRSGLPLQKAGEAWVEPIEDARQISTPGPWASEEPLWLFAGSEGNPNVQSMLSRGRCSLVSLRSCSFAHSSVSTLCG